MHRGLHLVAFVAVAVISGTMVAHRGGGGDAAKSRPPGRPKPGTARIASPAVVAPVRIEASDRTFAATVAGVLDCIEHQANFRDAVALVDLAEFGTDRERRIRQLVGMLADENPEWAASFAGALPSGNLQNTMLGLAAEAMARRYADGALDWVMTVPAGPARSAALDRVVGALAEKDLASAGMAVVALPSSLVRDEGMCSYAVCWTRSDPRSAIGWVDTFQEGLLKTRVLASIGYELAESGRGLEPGMLLQLHSPADRQLLEASVAYSEQLIRPDRAPARRD